MTRFAFALVTLALVGRADAAVDQKKVDEAVRKGVEYLRGHFNDTTHGTGVPSLVGLALLECDVPRSDPVIATITAGVRLAGLGENKTYNLALDILFLDKINDPRDVPLIQLLGARLAIGQNGFGGWGYTCGPDVPADEQARLSGSLRPTSEGGLHPEAAAVLRLRGAGAGAMGGDDNSNVQFAIIGTWVAQRRGLPSSLTISAIDGRFLRTQSPIDHGWAYSTSTGGATTSTPAMTCAGLLGLAVGKANDEARKAGKKLEGDGSPKAKPKNKENEDDPFFRPPANNAKPDKDEDPDEPDDDDLVEKKKPPTVRDMAIERALKALGRVLSGQGNGAGLGGGNWGGVNDLYFIWSLERVAVAYGLETVGDVNWYEWGLGQFLSAQQGDGSWAGTHGVPVSTAFAVLFLKKSNFVADLSSNLKGKVKDPGSGELKGSRGGPPQIAAYGRKIDPGTEGPPDPKSPNAGRVRGPSAADKIATELVAKQSDSRFDGRLKAARENKGGQYTAGLAQAIPLLADKRMLMAREALADRLTRMTPDTLKQALGDRDAELRRAACLAIGMKDARGLTFDLIERVADIDDIVVRAARASLKSMFTKDLGPPTGANDDRKRIALDDWKSWYTITGGKP